MGVFLIFGAQTASTGTRTQVWKISQLKLSQNSKTSHQPWLAVTISRERTPARLTSEGPAGERSWE